MKKKDEVDEEASSDFCCVCPSMGLKLLVMM